MNVSDICRIMNTMAPLSAAQEWDNAGLLVGREGKAVEKILLCIDLTQDVLNEAIDKNIDIIITYHPPIFKPLSRIKAEESPVVYEAIVHDISIYSPHTSFDVADGGTNDILAELVGLSDLRPLGPAGESGTCKVVTFVPPGDAREVAEAAFRAGAGMIGNYVNCSFMSHGVGSFLGTEDSNPSTGKSGEEESVNEVRLEMTCTAGLVNEVCTAIKNAHEYEEPPVDVYPLQAGMTGGGLGRAGRLQRPVQQKTLIDNIKKMLGLKNINAAIAGDDKRMIGTVAVAAGSCGSIWQCAIEAGAGLYLTGELKHHDALAAVQAGLTVVCAGHSNSERPILPVLAEKIAGLAPSPAEIIISSVGRDPYEIV